MTTSTSSSSSSSCPSAISLGSCIFGIPIRLHYSYFLLLLLVFVSSLLNYGQYYPLVILFDVVLYGPVLLVTILVHEFGHAFMTKRLGGSVDSIILWPLGGFALCGPTDDFLVGDLKVALAGPMTHIPMALLWWVIYVGVREEGSGLWPSNMISADMLSNSAAGFFQCLSTQTLYMNIILFCFNLFIPAYPLDGGRVFAASLILVFKLKSLTAAKVTSVTAMLISLGMIVYSVINYFSYHTTNSDLMIGLVGVFVFYQSYELWVAAKNNDLANHSIFGRKCYADNGGRNRGDSSSGNTSGREDEAAQEQRNETEIV